MGSPSQRWTLIATILASAIVFLDGSIVNVALPAIGRGLDTGLSGLQWIVDGYVLTLATLTQAFHWAMLASALMAGAAGLIAAVVIRNPSRPAQEETRSPS